MEVILGVKPSDCPPPAASGHTAVYGGVGPTMLVVGSNRGSLLPHHWEGNPGTVNGNIAGELQL